MFCEHSVVLLALTSLAQNTTSKLSSWGWHDNNKSEKVKSCIVLVFFLEGDGKIKPVCRETVGPIRRSRSRTCTSFSPPRSSGGSRLPVARQQARRRYSADAGDVAATTTTTRRGTCDTHTQTRECINWPVVNRCLMALTVVAGEDCALPRGLWGIRDWNTPICCKDWWETKERRERGRLEAKNESAVRSFTPKEESDVSTRWVPEGFGNVMKTQLKKKKILLFFFLVSFCVTVSLQGQQSV